jgi:capsular exopolysaccharide synthesis family protein
MASPTPPETPTLVASVSRNGRSAAPAVDAAQLVMLVDPRSAAAEAYRTLRTNIQFSSLDREVRSIAITSAGAGDGKSTTLANLAIAIAEGGHRVIAVDADLRRPGLHALFGLDNREGLTTAVLDDHTRLPLQDTPVPGLRLLASGPLPPNPAELVGSRRLDRVLRQLREAADYVLLDTPPAAALSDAPTLAARVDGVVLVIGAGRTKRELARRAKEQLERVQAHILGVVLAGVRLDTALYGY